MIDIDIDAIESLGERIRFMTSLGSLERFLRQGPSISLHCLLPLGGSNC